MATSLNKFGFHIVILLVFAMAVASCGRRGNLELPGTTQAESADGSILNPGESAESPEKPEVEKEDKPFFLDPLL